MGRTAAWLVVLLVASGTARAGGGERRGTLAVVNLTPQVAGQEVARRARETLSPYLGGWAREPGIAAFLEGGHHPTALPSGETGRELALLHERLRAGKALSRDLADLGRLLGVDYLLLLRVRGRVISAHLFSVGRGAYAPQSYEAGVDDLERLRGYVAHQTRAPVAPTPSATRSRRWWIWALAAGVGALTIGLALGARSEEKGDLRIRVSP